MHITAKSFISSLLIQFEFGHVSSPVLLTSNLLNHRSECSIKVMDETSDGEFTELFPPLP